MDVGKWLRRHAPGIKPIVAMNKSESLFDGSNSLKAAADEVYRLGFGDPIAISAETGLGMTELYEVLKPMLEDYMLHVLNGKKTSFSCRICHPTLKNLIFFYQGLFIFRTSLEFRPIYNHEIEILNIVL